MFFFHAHFSKLIFSHIHKIYTHCDAAESWQLNLQDPATPMAEGMLFFHNYLCFILIIIGVTTFWVLWTAVKTFNEIDSALPSQRFTHSSVLEIIWTILPGVALLIIAIPSFALLYSLDEATDPKITLKVIGSQWFWSYEYSDNYDGIFPGYDWKSIDFDSYMLPTSELVTGRLRLLEVDNRVTLPTQTHIRVLVSATDVLHSWSIPAFGIKIDACPGRLSQASLFIKREGIFYGQCSEICGVNHGFMPIVVRAVSMDTYAAWIIDRQLSLMKKHIT
jgi:cytochrome c oxidase subunit 2